MENTANTMETFEGATQETETATELSERIDFLKELNGQEVWTNAFSERFDERVCVGINYPNCVHEGKSFKPTKKEAQALWNDAMENEFGSSAQMKADLEAEFTPEYCAKILAQEKETKLIMCWECEKKPAHSQDPDFKDSMCQECEDNAIEEERRCDANHYAIHGDDRE